MLISPRLRSGGVERSGRVPEWLKGTGCKPVGFGLRRFESYPFHQAPLRLSARIAEGGKAIGDEVIGRV